MTRNQAAEYMAQNPPPSPRRSAVEIGTAMHRQYERDQRDCSIMVQRSTEQAEPLFENITFGEAVVILGRIASAFGLRGQAALHETDRSELELEVIGADQDDLFNVSFYIEVH